MSTVPCGLELLLTIASDVPYPIRYGVVVDVRIPTKRGKPVGRAFVEMDSKVGDGPTHGCLVVCDLELGVVCSC